MIPLLENHASDLRAAAAAFAGALSCGHFIAGANVEGHGDRLHLVHPATGRLTGELPVGTVDEVNRAVASARVAFEDGRWSAQSARYRGQVLVRLAELIESHREELALLETLDMGKPIRDAYQADVIKSANMIRWYGEAIDKIYGEVAPTSSDVHAFIRRAPLGVIACITPWNFPLYQAAYKIGPVLAAGNSLVVKPSELSPRSTRKVAELAVEAGVPEGVFNVVLGDGQTTGRALASHNDIDGLAFTGSSATARLVSAQGAQSLARTSIEAGGKSAHLVLPEVHDSEVLLEEVASAVVDGFCYNQGQVCSAGTRLLVHDDLADGLVERVIARTAKYQLGDPFDPSTSLGPVVSGAQLARIRGYVDTATREGARVVLADNAQSHPDEHGNWTGPVVLDHVDPRHTVAQEEVFGPVLAVIRYRHVDEAVQIANGTSFGLGAAVWSPLIDRALGVAGHLRAGQVWVNNYDGADYTVPWGGFKSSGHGRDKSLEALSEYTGSSTTWVKLNNRDQAS